MTADDLARDVGTALASVLALLHNWMSPLVTPALNAAVDHHDFTSARAIIADLDTVARAVEHAVLDRTGIKLDDLDIIVFSLVDTTALEDVLDALDPERVAREDKRIVELRASGNWTEADQAVHEVERLEAAMRFGVSS